MIDLFLGDRGRNTESYKIADKIRSRANTDFELQERIASGGNAVVHRCIDSRTGDEYAVKLLLKLSRKQKARFTQEIELLRGITHHHLMEYVDDGSAVAKNIESGRMNNIPFVVMPLAQSNLMKHFMNKSRKIAYEVYIAQFRGLAEALGVLHTQAVHRDIKPENILIIGETWLLSDFGLCRQLSNSRMQRDLSHENEVIGPRFWMSPEATNRAVGSRDRISAVSDVYQLASLFWFIATGRHPSGVLDRAEIPS